MDFDLDMKTDEDFFGALRRQSTNLGHLFEYEAQRGEMQESLKYEPPKVTAANGAFNANKSINTTSPITTVQAWKTLLAKVAQAYKEGLPVGKVGVALLQNAENECRIIVYKAKLNVLTTCSLHAQMPQVHRRSNYLQFYDDDLCCWSIYFDADANTEEFVAKLIELNFEVSKEAEKSEIELMTENTSEISASGVPKSREGDKPPIATSKPTKSALITRMAKMGQQLLPKLPPPPPAQTQMRNSIEATDSSDTETISTPGPLANHKHNPTPRNSNRALVKPQAMPVSELSYLTQPHTTGAALESQFMHMMLSESRTHNSELRMNINKLEGKVDKVLDKIELLHSNTGDKSADREDEMLALEEKLLELKKENRRLRQTIEEANESTPTVSCEQILKIYSTELAEVNLTNVDSLERLVGDLLRQRASLHEKLEQWERDLAVKNIELKTHQTRLDDDQDTLAKTIAKKEHLEVEIKSYQKRLVDKEKLECDLRHQLAESNKECITQRKKYEECMQREAHANELIHELQEQKKMLQHELDEKSKMDIVIRENRDHDDDHSSDDNNKLSVEKQIETVLKKTMNNLYANLATKLENIVPMQKNAVIAIIGKTIREETLKVMDEIKQ